MKRGCLHMQIIVYAGLRTARPATTCYTMFSVTTLETWLITGAQVGHLPDRILQLQPDAALPRADGTPLQLYF